jgi:hypothetical protein
MKTFKRKKTPKSQLQRANTTRQKTAFIVDEMGYPAAESMLEVLIKH